MLFLILCSFLRFPERYGCQLFNAIGITSFRPVELTLCTKHRLKVKSANYLQFTPFGIFHPKVPSKHKTKNIKILYIKNIGKTLVKCGWNYRIIWLHHMPSARAIRPKKITLSNQKSQLLSLAYNWFSRNTYKIFLKCCSWYVKDLEYTKISSTSTTIYLSK